MVTVLPERRLVLLLAARADCTVKTARRALVEGIDAIKGANLRDRLRRGLEDLNSWNAAADDACAPKRHPLVTRRTKERVR